MQLKSLINLVLAIISTSSIATAQLVPGPPGGGRPAPYPGDRPGNGGGHLVPGPRPPQPYPPPSQPPYGDYEIKRIYINRDIYNQSMDLRLGAGLNYAYQGWAITSVRAQTRPSYPGQTVAQLLVDGRVVASQVNPGYLISLVPQTTYVLDQNARQVLLSISGGTYVDYIDVELRRGYNSYPPGSKTIDISVWRPVYGYDRIDLSQYFDMWSYRGYRIEQMVVTARARYGNSYVNLMIDGRNMGQFQFFSEFSQSQTIRLNPPQLIGHGGSGFIVLNTSGEMTIESVTLIVR